MPLRLVLGCVRQTLKPLMERMGATVERKEDQCITTTMKLGTDSRPEGRNIATVSQVKRHLWLARSAARKLAVFGGVVEGARIGQPRDRSLHLGGGGVRTTVLAKNEPRRTQ